MAAPEQVGIQTELELIQLRKQVDKALGEKADQLPEYPVFAPAPTLLHVEQLRWVNQAFALLNGDDSTKNEQDDEGEEQGSEDKTPPGEPDTASVEPETGEEVETEEDDAEEEDEDESEDAPEAGPEAEPAKATTRRRATNK